MVRPADVTDWYGIVEKEMPTWKGILVISIASSIVQYIAYGFFGVNILKIYVPIFLLGNYSTIFLLSWFFWYRGYRRIRTFSTKQTGVLVAINRLDKNVDEDIKKVYERLDLLIKSEEFKQDIVIREVPYYLIPKDKENAYKLRKQADAALIIWGAVESGKKSSRQQTVFTPIYFSYRVGLDQQRASIINNILNILLSSKKWTIDEDNSIFDRDFLVKNLEILSLFSLGLILYFSKRNRKNSIEIFRRILKKLKEKNPLGADDLILKDNVRRALARMYLTEARNIQLWPGSKRVELSRELALKLAVLHLELEDEISHNLLLAQVEFSKGNMLECLRLLKRNVELRGNEPPVVLSLAFVYFYQEDLKNGWFWLKKAIDKYIDPEFASQFGGIAMFYEETMKKEGKAFLNFPLGIIYYKFVKDDVLAEQSLSLFMDLYKHESDEVYKTMHYHSEKILRRIRKARDSSRG